jgi:hypothetical protein
MQSKTPEKGFGLDLGNEVSLSSFSVDDEISDAALTISITDDSAVHDDDVSESHPAEIEAGREMHLGLEASGGGWHLTSGDIVEGGRLLMP